MPRPPSISADRAAEILREVEPSKAFYFYRGIDSPIDDSARSLKEFLGRVRTVEAQSLEFHTERGDFERWVEMLGDPGLAKEFAALRASGAKGEQLRSKLSAASQSRVDRLARATKKAPR